ncbi:MULTISPECIES: hypothetical protein [Brevundimonas]|uniref:hypothetical protein n=1 Tax=Brevundimonas TaxID=41275 RepID=UPI0025BFC8C8|nr:MULTISPECIES: hypothetical protein [Brevundimonas]
MRRLTDDEWTVTREPFSFVRATYADWPPKQRYMVAAWLDHYEASGWFYETGQAVVFERSTDALAFKIWITSDPFGLARRIRPQVAAAMALFELD